MKKLLFIPALLISILSFSQGIEFEHGTWTEVMSKAQLTNKPIFVDVFTTWCGPCKMMSKDIFPLEEVGKVYNEKFICYKIDAEKGEGPELAKKYEVRAYPTYLFIKPDGSLFYKALGSMPADKFIAEAMAAVAEMGDTKPLSVWDTEYAQKKSDPAYLLEYMKKRDKLGMSNLTLFNDYIALLPDSDRASEAVQKMYTKEARSLKIKTVAFENLQKNASRIPNANGMMFNAVMNSVNEATKTKNQQLFDDAMVAFDNMPAQTYLTKDEVCMQYYQQTNNVDKYLQYATNFANNNLMKLSLDSIKKKDINSITQLNKQYEAGKLGKMDSVQVAQLRTYSANAERDRVSRNLNNIAWEAFNKVTDKKILKSALTWSKRSMEIYPNYPMWMDTYANLQFKLGNKKQAISLQKKALSLTEKDSELYKDLEKTLNKMEAPATKSKK